jgi:hypothetical protein
MTEKFKFFSLFAKHKKSQLTAVNFSVPLELGFFVAFLKCRYDLRPSRLPFTSQFMILLAKDFYDFCCLSLINIKRLFEDLPPLKQLKSHLSWST